MVSKGKKDVNSLVNILRSTIDLILTKKEDKINGLTARLGALSPMAVLDRGYSITRKLPEKTIIMNSTMTNINETVEVLLARGSLQCQVKGKDGKKEDI